MIIGHFINKESEANYRSRKSVIEFDEWSDILF
jgi:hypothetical protein